MSAILHFEGRAAAPEDVIGACLGHAAAAVLLEQDALPPGFFDLSTGVAGEFAQKLVNYGIRAAVVVPDITIHSVHFQAFASEAGLAWQLSFFATREAADAWLSGR